MTSFFPLRIALISAHTSPLARLGSNAAGGMNVYVRETALELGRRGHYVDIFTRDDGAEPEARPREIDSRVRLVPIEAGPRTPLSKEEQLPHLPGFLNGIRAFRAAESIRYDIVHAHYWMSGWVGRHLQRLWSVPHVTMFHTLGEAKRRARPQEVEPERRIDEERRIALSADRLVVASPHEQTLLERHFSAAADRISVIPCGVDLDRFRPGDAAFARQQLGLPQHEQIVLFAGRLEPLKGLELLIDAVAQTKDSRPYLVVVGGAEDAYTASLMARVARQGLTDRVHFAGPVAHTVLASYYRAADICVVPSFYESFGLVALEAMASGIPVVATRVGGLPSIVREGMTGYLIPWRRPAAFAEKIDLLLSNDELRAAMARQSRHEAQRFRWSCVVAELEQMYHDTIAEHAATGCHGAGDSRQVACHA